MASDKIKVCIKVRPLIPRELKDENTKIHWKTNRNTIISTDGQIEKTFDNIYNEKTTTKQLFEDCAKPIVEKAMNGFNGTIFAYGQTSSGKTHAMMGTEEDPGVIKLAVEEIFRLISSIPDRVYLVRCGYIEIYNEKIFDLLNKDKSECTKIRETQNGEVKINQVEFVAVNAAEIMEFYEIGNQRKKIADNGMNDRSSRSHTIFRITIESKNEGNEEGAVKVSNLNLVDLAGSERLSQTNAVGERLIEGKNINLSLLSLSNVIRMLSDETTKSQFINKRDSKLTRILSSSLGGNAVTTIICTITPVSLEETKLTLNFAQNAKKIKNEPFVNEIMSDEVLMKTMRKTIEELKSKLECEKVKNNELEKRKILEDISNRERQFLHSHNSSTKMEINRRRTWCSSSVNDSIKMPPPSKPMSKIPVPPFCIPKSERVEIIHTTIQEFDEEEFKPAIDKNFDEILQDEEMQRNTEEFGKLIKTPRAFKFSGDQLNISDLSDIDTNERKYEKRINFLENELSELNDFVKIESLVVDDHRKLAAKLQNSNETIEVLNGKIEVLELELSEAKKLLAENDVDQKVKLAQSERDKALKAKLEAESTLAGIEIEYENYKSRSKKRESELLSMIRPDDENHDIKEKLNDFELKLFQANEEREKLAENHKKAMADLTTEYDEISMQLMDKLNDIEKLQKKIQDEELNSRDIQDKASARMAEMNFQIEELSMELIKKSQIVTELENSVVNKELELSSEITELKKGLELLMTLDVENGRLKKVEKESKKQSTEMAGKEKFIKELKKRLNDSNEEILKLQKDSQLLFNECNMKIQKLEEEHKQNMQDLIRDFTSKIFASENVTEELQDRLEKAEKLVESLKNQNFDEESRNLMKYEIQIQSLNQEIESFGAVIKRKDEIIESLEVGRNQMEIELNLKTEEIENLHQNLKSAEDQLAETENLKKNLENLLEVVRQENENLLLETNEDKVQADSEWKAECDQKIDELNQEIVKLNSLIDEKDEKINSDEDTKVELESKLQQIENLEKLQILSEERLNEAENSKKNLQSSLDVAQDENAKLISELNELQEKFNKNAADNTKDFGQKLEELNEQISDFNAVLSEKDKMFKTLEETKIELEAKIDSNLTEIENLQSSKLAVEKALTNSEILNQNLQSSLDSARQDNEKMSAELEEIRHKLSEGVNFNQEIANLNNLMSVKDSTLKELEEVASTLRTEIEKKSTEIESLQRKQSEITELLAELGNEKKNLQISLDSASQDNEKMSIELDEIRGKLTESANFNQEIADLKELVNEKDETVKKLESITSELRAEIEGKLTEIEKLHQSQSELNEQLAETENSKKNIQNLLDLAHQENENLMAELDGARNQSIDKSDQIEMENLKQKLFDTSNEISALTDILESTKSQLESMKNENENFQLMIEKLSSEKIELENVIKDKEVEIIKIDAEKTNLDSKLILNDAEIEKLQSTVKRQAAENEEIKTLVRRRSSDNNKQIVVMEREKDELVQKIGAAEAKRVLAEHKLSDLTAAHAKLESEKLKVETDMSKLKESASENDYKITVLEEQIEQCKATIKTLENTVNGKQLEIFKLTEEKDEVQKNFNEVKSKRPSPNKNRDSELFAPHLVKEKSAGTPRAVERNNDRRRSRQNLQDGNRRFYSSNKFESVAVQTEAVSDICACTELQIQNKELRVEAVKNKCRITAMEQREAHHPLKVDVDNLTRKLLKEERDHKSTKNHLESANKNIYKLETKIEILLKEQKSQSNHVNAKEQDFEELVKRFTELKSLYRQNHEKLMEMERQQNSKENVSANVQKLSSSAEAEVQILKKRVQELEEANNRLQTDDVKSMKSQLKKEVDTVQKKYEIAKRLCNLRNDDNNKLRLEVDNLTTKLTELKASHEKELSVIRNKYSTAKEICEFRRKKVQELEEKLKDNEHFQDAQD